MPPVRSKKRKSSTSPTEVPNFPTPPNHIAMQPLGPSRTPARSPTKSRTRTITNAQKQALIDNLQLEITERARRLRAQYAMQAQGLQTRIEIRVNRIPMSLRRANMGDLLARCTVEQDKKSRSVPEDVETSKTISPPALDKAFPLVKDSKKRNEAVISSGSNNIKSTKRSSEVLDSVTDKENSGQNELANPKKRAKPNPTSTAATRAASRSKMEPNQILSPKSSNSRTVPISPARRTPSPGKSDLVRRVSPFKQIATAKTALAGMVEKAKSTRAGKAAVSAAPATKGKRGAQPAATTQKSQKLQRDRVISNSSDASTGTVVTKPKTTTARQAPEKAKAAGTTTRARKPPLPKVEASTTTKRVLRKRG
ncbi:MAG: hypothetical protein M1837_003046 [Sclerophora amabilis]|nr:MAG: hypothetical protein M1837_003046 [Sclerophora amabilis]